MRSCLREGRSLGSAPVGAHAIEYSLGCWLAHARLVVADDRVIRFVHRCWMPCMYQSKEGNWTVCRTSSSVLPLWPLRNLHADVELFQSQRRGRSLPSAVRECKSTTPKPAHCEPRRVLSEPPLRLDGPHTSQVELAAIIEKELISSLQGLVGDVQPDGPFMAAGLDSSSACRFVELLEQRRLFQDLFPGNNLPPLHLALYNHPTPRQFAAHLVRCASKVLCEHEMQRHGSALSRGHAPQGDACHAVGDAQGQVVCDDAVVVPCALARHATLFSAIPLAHTIPLENLRKRRAVRLTEASSKAKVSSLTGAVRPQGAIEGAAAMPVSVLLPSCSVLVLPSTAAGPVATKPSVVLKPRRRFRLVHSSCVWPCAWVPMKECASSEGAPALTLPLRRHRPTFELAGCCFQLPRRARAAIRIAMGAMRVQVGGTREIALQRLVSARACLPSATRSLPGSTVSDNKGAPLPALVPLGELLDSPVCTFNICVAAPLHRGFPGKARTEGASAATRMCSLVAVARNQLTLLAHGASPLHGHSSPRMLVPSVRGCQPVAVQRRRNPGAQRQQSLGLRAARPSVGERGRRCERRFAQAKCLAAASHTRGVISMLSASAQEVPTVAQLPPRSFSMAWERCATLPTSCGGGQPVVLQISVRRSSELVVAADGLVVASASPTKTGPGAWCLRIAGSRWLLSWAARRPEPWSTSWPATPRKSRQLTMRLGAGFGEERRQSGRRGLGFSTQVAICMLGKNIPTRGARQMLWQAYTRFDGACGSGCSLSWGLARCAWLRSPVVPRSLPEIRGALQLVALRRFLLGVADGTGTSMSAGAAGELSPVGLYVRRSVDTPLSFGPVLGTAAAGLIDPIDCYRVPSAAGCGLAGLLRGCLGTPGRAANGCSNYIVLSLKHSAVTLMRAPASSEFGADLIRGPVRASIGRWPICLDGQAKVSSLTGAVHPQFAIEGAAAIPGNPLVPRCPIRFLKSAVTRAVATKPTVVLEPRRARLVHSSCFWPCEWAPMKECVSSEGGRGLTVPPRHHKPSLEVAGCRFQPPLRATRAAMRISIGVMRVQVNGASEMVLKRRASARASSPIALTASKTSAKHRMSGCPSSGTNAAPLYALAPFPELLDSPFGTFRINVATTPFHRGFFGQVNGAREVALKRPVSSRACRPAAQATNNVPAKHRFSGFLSSGSKRALLPALVPLAEQLDSPGCAFRVNVTATPLHRGFCAQARTQRATAATGICSLVAVARNQLPMFMPGCFGTLGSTVNSGGNNVLSRRRPAARLVRPLTSSAAYLIRWPFRARSWPTCLDGQVRSCGRERAAAPQAPLRLLTPGRRSLEGQHGDRRERRARVASVRPPSNVAFGSWQSAAKAGSPTSLALVRLRKPASATQNRICLKAWHKERLYTFTNMEARALSQMQMLRQFQSLDMYPATQLSLCDKDNMLVIAIGRKRRRPIDSSLMWRSILASLFRSWCKRTPRTPNWEMSLAMTALSARRCSPCVGKDAFAVVRCVSPYWGLFLPSWGAKRVPQLEPMGKRDTSFVRAHIAMLMSRAVCEQGRRPQRHQRSWRERCRDVSQSAPGVSARAAAAAAAPATAAPVSPGLESSLLLACLERDRSSDTTSCTQHPRPESLKRPSTSSCEACSTEDFRAIAGDQQTWSTIGDAVLPAPIGKLLSGALRLGIGSHSGVRLQQGRCLANRSKCIGGQVTSQSAASRTQSPRLHFVRVVPRLLGRNWCTEGAIPSTPAMPTSGRFAQNIVFEAAVCARVLAAACGFEEKVAVVAPSQERDTGGFAICGMPSSLTAARLKVKLVGAASLVCSPAISSRCGLPCIRRIRQALLGGARGSCLLPLLSDRRRLVNHYQTASALSTRCSSWRGCFLPLVLLCTEDQRRDAGRKLRWKSS